MRAIVLLVSFFLFLQPVNSQENKAKKTDILKDTITSASFEPVFFILGTLSDYMGRFQYVDRVKQVDRYDPYERPMVEYLSRYIKSELEIEVDTVFEKTDHCKMFSDDLSMVLNSFYGEKDEILDSTFKTDQQICSFLAGVYYRFGEKLDTAIYKIQIANSSKPQKCEELLKLIGCEKTYFQYLRNIPAQFIVYFKPTDELITYLDKIETEKTMLQESYYSYFVELFEDNVTLEEIKSNYQKSREDELKKVKRALK